MPTIDERVAYLEGRVEEHSRGFGELRNAIQALDEKVDRRLDSVDERIYHLTDQINHLTGQINQRFGVVDERFGQIDAKMDQRFGQLDDRVSRQFLWIMGVQIAVLVAIIGTIAQP